MRKKFKDVIYIWQTACYLKFIQNNNLIKSCYCGQCANFIIYSLEY